MTIGERIKQKRLENQMTLLEVANLIGVKEATVQRYESGEIKNLKQHTIAHLAEIFHTTPAYLMGWEEKKTKSDSSADTEADKLFERVKQLPEERQKQAFDFLRFLLDQQDNR